MNQEKMPSLNLRSLPGDTTHPQQPDYAGGIWIIAGPGWRDHIEWRITTLMDRGVSDIYWMGSGRIGSKIPPSGVISSPKEELPAILRRWKSTTAPKNRVQRILVVEDPQGAGIWEDLNRSPSWRSILEHAKEMGCLVILGTNIGIPRAGVLLDLADWFHIRSGGAGAVEELTSGMTSLGGWLDGVGRDVFDDIRVYRRLLGIMGGHRKDIILWLSNDSDVLTDRVFWWDPAMDSSGQTNTSPTNQRSADYSTTLLRRDTANPREEDDGAVAMVASRVVRKLRIVIGLLEELCDELEDSFTNAGSDDDSDG